MCMYEYERGREREGLTFTKIFMYEGQRIFQHLKKCLSLKTPFLNKSLNNVMIFHSFDLGYE